MERIHTVLALTVGVGKGKGKQMPARTHEDTAGTKNSSIGFSLVELIVTVLIIGIIVAIAIPVFLNVQDSARQAAVESAARDGQVMARASIIDGSDLNGGNLSALETDDVVLSLSDTFVPGDESTVCVRADWIGTGEATNYAVSGPCDEADTTVPIVDREPDDPLYTQLTYQCPTDRTGYLGIVNVGEGTRVQMWDDNNRDATIREVHYGEPEDDFDLRFESRQEILRTRIVEDTGSAEEADEELLAAIRAIRADDGEEKDAPEYSQEETIRNASEKVQMEANVRYVVRFDGEIETFSSPGHGSFGNDANSIVDCLVSIDHFGDDINLKNIVYLGGDNLRRVPDSIPPSVRSLRGAFENATEFNDANISSWETENVHSLRSTFYNTLNFNRSLSGWDVSNVTSMQSTFFLTSSFNNGGEPLDWVTSRVTNMNGMFRGAAAFNQDLSDWDVDNVDGYSRFSDDSGLEERHLPVLFATDPT